MRFGNALLAALAVATTACATTRYDWDYDLETDFHSYQTFDWMSPPGTVVDERNQFPLLELRLKRAFEHELRAIGYEKVDSDPDFYVAFHAAAGRRLTRAYFDLWGYRYFPRRPPRWHTGLVVVNDYREGSLILDVVDARTDELVWRGVAEGFPFGEGDPDRTQVEKTARAILEGFPPRAMIAAVASGGDTRR